MENSWVWALQGNLYTLGIGPFPLTLFFTPSMSERTWSRSLRPRERFLWVVVQQGVSL